MSSLRILHLYPKHDYFTGAAIQLRELAHGLHRRGHEVVVATRPARRLVEKAGQMGLTHYAVPMASQVDLRSARQLAHIVRRHAIQIVHAHKGRARTLALVAGLFTRIPVLVLNRGVSFPARSPQPSGLHHAPRDGHCGRLSRSSATSSPPECPPRRSR